MLRLHVALQCVLLAAIYVTVKGQLAITSDRGPQIVSKLGVVITTLPETKSNHLTTFHNGKVERKRMTLKMELHLDKIVKRTVFNRCYTPEWFKAQ